jgi:hypothetical protein
MTPTEIVANDPETQKAGAAKVLAGMSKVLKSGLGMLLRSQNTVLFLIAIEKNVAELHIYSVDKPAAIGAAMKDFEKKIVDSELERVYGSAPLNSPIMRLMSMMGFQVLKSDKPNYTWMANV